jgi:hypothetical protein
MLQCDDCKNRMLAAGAAMTRYICPHCLKQQISGSTYCPRLCINCAEKLNRCQRCCKELQLKPKTEYLGLGE